MFTKGDPVIHPGVSDDRCSSAEESGDDDMAAFPPGEEVVVFVDDFHMVEICVDMPGPLEAFVGDGAACFDGLVEINDGAVKRIGDVFSGVLVHGVSPDLQDSWVDVITVSFLFEVCEVLEDDGVGVDDVWVKLIEFFYDVFDRVEGVHGEVVV